MAHPQLELLLDFVNTHDVESQVDAISTPDELAGWMRDRGLATPVPLSETDRLRAVELREALRLLGESNNGGRVSGDGLAALNELAAGAPLQIAFAADRYELIPSRGGVDELVGAVLAGVAGAVADGSWDRVKACHNHACRWLFLDTSRNRSRTWCEMAVCGSRMKSRAYRSRRRAAP